MVKYYHGTHCDAVPHILKQGLLVCRDAEGCVHPETLEYDVWRDPDIEKMHGKRFAKYGVYLAEDMYDALPYAYDASKGVRGLDPDSLNWAESNPDKACIIEVNIPKSMKIGNDGFGAVMTKDEDIPPEYITKVYYPKDWKELGLGEF